VKGIVKNRRNLATGGVADLIQLTTGRANELGNVILSAAWADSYARKPDSKRNMEV